MDNLKLREDIVAFARSKIGIRWKHQGRTDYGLDCVGLVVVCAKHFNFTQFDFTRYSPRPQSRKFIKAFYDGGCSRITPWSLTKLLPGDIVVMSYGIYPMHCGIYATRDGVPTVIHSSAIGRKVREEDLVAPLSAQVFGGFRYPGID